MEWIGEADLSITYSISQHYQQLSSLLGYASDKTNKLWAFIYPVLRARVRPYQFIFDKFLRKTYK